MKFLLCFKINPIKRLLNCIPFRITIILISLLCVFFGIINFIVVILYDDKFQNDPYIFIYLACSIIAPLIFIYTSFKEDETMNYIAYYFHSLYVIFITIMYLLAILILLIIDAKFITKYYTAFIVQFLYNIFVIFSNFIYFSFHNHYESLFNADQVNELTGTAYSNAQI